MPPRNQVPSLNEICLSFVSSHMNIWCGEDELEFRKKLKSNSIEISTLPKTILDVMINCKKYTHRLRSYHLDLFIHKNVYQLNLSGRSDATIQRGITLIGNICVNIRNLNISNSDVSETSLKTLVKSIPTIEILELESTATSDRVLAIVGNYCPNLRKLSVFKCVAVTDIGINFLCNQIEMQDGSKYGGKCKHIEKLILPFTSVTDAGAVMAIRNLPHLQIFDYQSTLSAIETIYRQNNFAEFLPEGGFKLREICNWSSIIRDVSNFAINAAICLCRYVSSVSLKGLKNTDEWIPQLSEFPQLTVLSLESSVHNPVQFEKHTAPLLEQCGENVKGLLLTNFERINLWDVGRYCGQCHLLYLARNRYYLSMPYCELDLQQGIFSRVDSIFISCLPDHDIPRDQLEILLSNSIHLHTLFFEGCQSVTDDLLHRVLRHNSFSQLHRLVFRMCNNVKKATVIEFINLSNTLRIVTCFGCAGIRGDDRHEFQSFIQDENLNIEISID